MLGREFAKAMCTVVYGRCSFPIAHSLLDRLFIVPHFFHAEISSPRLCSSASSLPCRAFSPAKPPLTCFSCDFPISPSHGLYPKFDKTFPVKNQRYFLPAPTTFPRKTSLLPIFAFKSPSPPSNGLNCPLIQLSNTSQKNNRMASSVAGLVGLFGMPPPPPPPLPEFPLPVVEAVELASEENRDEVNDVPVKGVAAREGLAGEEA